MKYQCKYENFLFFIINPRDHEIIDAKHKAIKISARLPSGCRRNIIIKIRTLNVRRTSVTCKWDKPVFSIKW
jgi:hypothetical protein